MSKLNIDRDWIRQKALEEGGHDIGAGSPDHPLREPERMLRKEAIRDRATIVVDQIDYARLKLSELMDSLEMLDVRQSDFASDAALWEHFLVLRDMSQALQKAISAGSVLDEHMDREVAS